MLLRTFLLLLLAANVGFYAWHRGWLDPAAEAAGLATPGSGREPQRLAQQVRPEVIRLLPMPAATSAPAPASAPAAETGASAPVSAGTACLEAGPFDADERPPVEAALRDVQPALQWEWRDVAPGWWLALGPFPDRASAGRRSDELQRRGFTAETVDSGAALMLVLGRHAQRAEADAQLATLAARGVRGARVLAPPTAASQQKLRVPAADARQQERLVALTRDQVPAHRFALCAEGT